MEDKAKDPPVEGKANVDMANAVEIDHTKAHRIVILKSPTTANRDRSNRVEASSKCTPTVTVSSAIPRTTTSAK